MNIVLRNFIIKNIIAALILVPIGGLIFYFVLQSFYHPLFPVITALALLTNILVFHLFVRSNISGIKLNGAVLRSFAIKFFAYLIMALVFLLTVKERNYRIAFVVLLFVLYILFTSIEVTSIIKLIKREK